MCRPKSLCVLALVRISVDVCVCVFNGFYKLWVSVCLSVTVCEGLFVCVCVCLCVWACVCVCALCLMVRASKARFHVEREKNVSTSLCTASTMCVCGSVCVFCR